MVTRRRSVAKVNVLPPDVVPMSKQDEQQAVQAIAAMIAQWRRKHGHDDDSPDAATKSAITTKPGVGPQRRPHLARELGKRGSYSATYGPLQQLYLNHDPLRLRQVGLHR